MKYLQGHLVIPKLYKGYNSYNKIRTHITPYDGPFFFKEHQFEKSTPKQNTLCLS